MPDLPAFDLTLFAAGCLGGLLPDVLRIIKSRYDTTLPAYLRSPLFWVGLLFSVVIGGLAAWLFAARQLNEAVAYGFTAPGLLEGLAGSLGVQRPARGPRTPDVAEPARFTLGRWWAV